MLVFLYNPSSRHTGSKQKNENTIVKRSGHSVLVWGTFWTHPSKARPMPIVTELYRVVNFKAFISCREGYRSRWQWRMTPSTKLESSSDNLKSMTPMLSICNGRLSDQTWTKSSVYGIFWNNAWKCFPPPSTNEEWFHISPAAFQILVDATPLHTQAVLAARGDLTPCYVTLHWSAMFFSRPVLSQWISMSRIPALSTQPL